MRKTTFSIVMFSMLSVSVAVSAADQMKPGLWAMTMKSDAMKNMPKMSPEQMEQMRKMGVKMPQMQDGGMMVKVCMTKEMVERDQPPMGQNESGCQLKNFNRSGNTYSAEMLCDGPNMKGTGTIKGMHSGRESLSSTYDFKGTVQGQPVDTHHETSGKWLGSDCGDVKPVSEHSPKK
jgi:hypothetical protein